MVFRGDCPHCGTTSVAFTHKTSIISNRLGQQWTDAVGECGHCGRGIIAMVQGNVQKVEEFYRHGMTIAPSLPPTSAPAHTPPNVARFFEQGMENLARNFDAAGTMFRKALDIALKESFPELHGTLMHRIDSAAATGILTADMAAWAHQIRRLGNDAAHEAEPFSENDAKDLHNFTDLILRYLFTLPGMLEDARGDPEDTSG